MRSRTSGRASNSWSPAEVKALCVARRRRNSSLARSMRRRTASGCSRAAVCIRKPSRTFVKRRRLRKKRPAVFSSGIDLPNRPSKNTIRHGLNSSSRPDETGADADDHESKEDGTNAQALGGSCRHGTLARLPGAGSRAANDRDVYPDRAISRSVWKVQPGGRDRMGQPAETHACGFGTFGNPGDTPDRPHPHLAGPDPGATAQPDRNPGESAQGAEGRSEISRRG